MPMRPGGMATVSIEREKLYEQIWTIPASRLAFQYGISDVGLAKACKRHFIPRPPRGYWARLQAGQKVKRTPLPKVKDPAIEIVQMQGWDLPEETLRNLLTEAKDTGTVASPIQPPEKTHELVTLAREQLLNCQPDHDGLVCTDAKLAPQVRVSPALVDRALQIMNSFISRWEERGGQIQIDSKLASTVVRRGVDSFGLRIFEQLDESQSVTSDQRRTGRLCLLITGDENRQFRRRWNDTKTQRLEKLLSSLIEVLVHALEAKKLDRLDDECEQRQNERLKVQRAKRANHASHEFYNRQGLMTAVDRWHDAQRIRSYVSGLNAAYESKQFQPADEHAFRDWIAWVVAYAASIDPILQAPLPGKEQRGPKNVECGKLDLTSATRAVVERLKAANTDELWKKTEDEVRNAKEEIRFGHVWNEMTRVLEALGYDVSKRRGADAYW